MDSHWITDCQQLALASTSRPSAEPAVALPTLLYAVHEQVIGRKDDPLERLPNERQEIYQNSHRERGNRDRTMIPNMMTAAPPPFFPQLCR